MSNLANSPLVKGDRREYWRRLSDFKPAPAVDPAALRRLAARLTALADEIEGAKQ